MTAISPSGAPVATAASPPLIKPVNPADYRPALLNVGVIVWLASELMFFSGLFAAFFTLRASTPVWPPKGDILDVHTVLYATILLVVSSGTMQMAVGRTVRGDRAGFLGWLALTFCLGALFDGMQISDYMSRPFPIDQNAWTSCFYVLTGIHALHVFGGLFGMVVMGIRAKKSKHFGHRTAPAVEFLSYYWHFVDVVWIALFAAIFLLK
ncbi:heme-copper oxidase subunit III [Acidiferrimicrobium sp. IK]|uniref:cytochrome c oxidase subunit 3 n=1 Tax=Acidiferrimicrobium sp. IK TaxID=2871700 RepID=UPI0021CB2EE4|nr:heme-copper oxidase subunit III [Acidiferrimicrobium sp. IK]MCU4186311.1 heme-copper oxidase subunit III [Acidiferrimicrobium sp. IK]